MNHTRLIFHQSAITIKFAGDTDFDANIGIKTCLSQAKQKLQRRQLESLTMYDPKVK